MDELLEKLQETGAAGYPVSPTWKRADPPDYKGFGHSVDAVLVADDEDGGYVASIAQLPGVHSQGDNAESAMRNIVEAFCAVIQAYRDEGMAIPWRSAPPKEPNEEWFRIAV